MEATIGADWQHLIGPIVQLFGQGLIAPFPIVGDGLERSVGFVVEDGLIGGMKAYFMWSSKGRFRAASNSAHHWGGWGLACQMGGSLWSPVRH